MGRERVIQKTNPAAPPYMYVPQSLYGVGCERLRRAVSEMPTEINDN